MAQPENHEYRPCQGRRAKVTRLVQERAGPAEDALDGVGVCTPRGAELVEIWGLGCKQVGIVVHELLNSGCNGVARLVQETPEISPFSIEKRGSARQEAFKPRDESPGLEASLLLLLECLHRSLDFMLQCNHAVRGTLDRALPVPDTNAQVVEANFEEMLRARRNHLKSL